MAFCVPPHRAKVRVIAIAQRKDRELHVLQEITAGLRLQPSIKLLCVVRGFAFPVSRNDENLQLINYNLIFISKNINYLKIYHFDIN